MAYLIWTLHFLIVWQFIGPVTCQQRTIYAYTTAGGVVELIFQIQFSKYATIDITQTDPPTNNILLRFKHLETGDDWEYGNVTYRGRVSRVELTGAVLRVTLSGVTLADGGLYACLVHHEIISFKLCLTTLIILGKPNRPSIEVQGLPIVGQGIRLICKHFPGMRPIITTTDYAAEWELENDKIQASRQGFVLDNDYVIPFVIKRLSGTQFVCYTRDRVAEYKANAPLSDASNKYYLNVAYAPENKNMSLVPKIVDDDTIIRRADEVLKVTCDVDCNPGCYVYWSHQALNAESFTNLSMRDPNILRIEVNRQAAGTYQCSAYNKHGTTSKSFNLNVNYIQDVTISVNDVVKDAVDVPENEPAILKCTTIADPLPVLVLKSSAKTLVTGKGLSPEVSNGPDGSVINTYTVSHTIQSTECDSPADYYCEAKQGYVVIEKNISLAIQCDIVKAGISGLDLMSEYTFERGSDVVIEFVLKAFPEPKVTSVISRLKGTTKEYEAGLDYDLKVGSHHYGKHYLTMFKFRTLHKLEVWDDGVELTIDFQAGKFRKSYSFKVNVAGITTPAITTPTELVVTNATTRATTELKTPSTTEEDTEDGSFKVTPIMVVAGIIVLLAILAAIYLLLMSRRNSISSDVTGRGSKVVKRNSSESEISADLKPAVSAAQSKYDV